MKELPRFSKKEKEELLLMFTADRDTYILAKTMALKYLKVYPSEKKFAKHVREHIKDYKYGLSWVTSDYNGIKLTMKSVYY